MRTPLINNGMNRILYRLPRRKHWDIFTLCMSAWSNLIANYQHQLTQVDYLIGPAGKRVLEPGSSNGDLKNPPYHKLNSTYSLTGSELLQKYNSLSGEVTLFA